MIYCFGDTANRNDCCNTAEKENMNEFYLSYKESKTAFADYQQKVEGWKKGYDNVVVSKDRTETMSEKLDRLQNEVESSRQYNKQNQAKWAR